MRGLHLKQRRGWWYYQRCVPDRYKSVDSSGLITFALKTRNLSEAKLRAAEISLELEEKWDSALEQGEPLQDHKPEKRFQAAKKMQKKRGFDPKPTEQITDDELLERLRSLLETQAKPQEQKAVLGMVKKPELSMQAAFDRFWEHIKEEWVNQSHDQKRTKRNIYLKAIRLNSRACCQIREYSDGDSDLIRTANPISLGQ